MRSAAQINRSPRGWKDHLAAERERLAGELRRDLAAARARGEEWIGWIDAGCPRLSPEEYARRTGNTGRPRARRGKTTAS